MSIFSYAILFCFSNVMILNLHIFVCLLHYFQLAQFILTSGNTFYYGYT